MSSVFYSLAVNRQNHRFATCRHYEIPALASYDSDFKEICTAEQINLFSSVEELNNVEESQSITDSEGEQSE